MLVYKGSIMAVAAAQAPSAIRYDKDKVQASPDPDPLAGLMARCDEMEREIIALKKQEVEQCDEIRKKCQYLPELESTVICMYYIGMIRVEKIAEDLHYSAQSIYKIRRLAQSRLAGILEKSERV